MNPVKPAIKPYSHTNLLPRWVTVGVGVAIVAALGLHVWTQVVKGSLMGDPTGSLQYQEFLINFEGGPVRRGLLGQLMLWLTQLTGLSPIPFINLLAISAYVAFTLWMLRRTRRTGWSWWLALSPLMCGYVNDVIRKDYLQLLLLVPILAMCARQRLTAMRCAAITALLILELLLHEAFIFWGAPLPLLVMLTDRRHRRAGIVCTTLVVITFLLQCRFHGSLAVTERIVASWQQAWPAATSLSPHIFGGIDWEILPTIDLHLHNNFYDPTLGWGLIGARIVAFIINGLLVTQFAGAFGPGAGTDAGRGLTVRVTRLYLMLAVCMLPLFTVLSCDFSRLYLYLATTTVMGSMMLRPGTLDRATGWFATGPATRMVTCIDTHLTLRTRQWLIVALLLICGDATDGFLWQDWRYQTVIGSLWYAVKSLVSGALA